MHVGTANAVVIRVPLVIDLGNEREDTLLEEPSSALDRQEIGLRFADRGPFNFEVPDGQKKTAEREIQTTP